MGRAHNPGRGVVGSFVSRLMSVTLTEAAVLDRSKTVTRRLGWRMLTVGTKITLCRKVMGRRRADGTVDPLVRLAQVEVVAVGQEPLDAITNEDVHREGFPGKDREWFLDFFTHHMRCNADDEVTRIEWSYLPGVMIPDSGARLWG